MSGPPPRTPPATFQPRFALSLLYLGALFLAYALLLIAPELWELARPAGPEEQQALEQAASELARSVVAPRLPMAFALAVATLFLGAWRGFLPGLRPPR